MQQLNAPAAPVLNLPAMPTRPPAADYGVWGYLATASAFVAWLGTWTWVVTSEAHRVGADFATGLRAGISGLCFGILVALIVYWVVNIPGRARDKRRHARHVEAMKQWTADSEAARADYLQAYGAWYQGLLTNIREDVTL